MPIRENTGGTKPAMKPAIIPKILVSCWFRYFLKPFRLIVGNNIPHTKDMQADRPKPLLMIKTIETTVSGK